LLTRSVLNKGIRSFKLIDSNLEEQLVTNNPRTGGNSNFNLDRKNGGRPKGSTDKAKKDLADAAMAVNNEVTATYLKLVMLVSLRARFGSVLNVGAYFLPRALVWFLLLLLSNLSSSLSSFKWQGSVSQ